MENINFIVYHQISKNPDAAARIKELRLAALADEDGTKLRNYLNA